MSPIKYKHGGILIYEGSQFDVIAAVTNDTKSPFYHDYFSKKIEKIKNAQTKKRSLRKDDIEAFQKLYEFIKKFADHGAWGNKEQLKPVEGTEFFEFKAKKQHRVFFYYDTSNRKVVVLTHHIVKKSNKIPEKELRRMESIKQIFENRKADNGK